MAAALNRPPISSHAGTTLPSTACHSPFSRTSSSSFFPSGRPFILRVVEARSPLFVQSSTNSSARTHGDGPLTGLRFCLPELGLNEKEAEILIAKHPPLAFTSRDSLRRRIHLLQSVGLSAVAIYRVVIKHPEILTSTDIGSLLEFIHDELQGLKSAKLERILISTRSQLFTGFKKRLRLLVQQGVPSDKLPHILNNVNIRKVFYERPVKEIKKMIGFLKDYGWPELIVRRPAIMNLDLDNQLIPRVQFLNELGGGDIAATGFLIGKLPAILSYSLEHYRSHVDFWNSVGLSDQQLFRIALVYPNVFSVSKERKLQPRVEFLKQCRLDVDDMFKFLIKAPLFISLSEDNLAKKLCFLAKIGYRYRTKELAAALGWATRTSCENMQAVIGLFFSYGLSCDDVLAMSKKHPQVLQYNHDSLEKKMEFLIEGMEREVDELLAFPAFLGYKLDDRIKQRYEAKKDIRGKEMSLNKLLSVSHKKFYMEKITSEADAEYNLESVIAE